MPKLEDTESAHAGTSGDRSTAAPRHPQSDEALLTLARDGRVRSRDEIIREVQDYMCGLAPAERVFSEELIAERRREFEMEEAENKAVPPGPRQ